MKALRRLLVVAAAVVLPLASLAQEAPKPPPISFYGILYTGVFFNGGSFKAQDAAYQGLLTSNGGAYYMTARQSRAGMKLNLGNDNLLGANLTGVLEFDFMGGNTATNSVGAYNPNPRLRHAAVTASWGELSVLLGQEWPLILNLNPDSVAYLANPVFGQSGNVFKRAPQVRLSYMGAAGDIGYGVQAAVLAPADANTTTVDLGAGNLSRSPSYEARAQLSLKGDVGGTVGVAYDTETRRWVGPAGKDVTTSLLGVDADLNLTKFAQVKGEWFQDEGEMDEFAGLTASGFSVGTNMEVVKSSGYWAQIILKPIPEVFVTGGMGQAEIDKPSLRKAKGAAIAAGDRTLNESTTVGLIVNLSKSWRAGVDYYMTTSTYGDAVKTKVSIQQIAIGSTVKF